MLAMAQRLASVCLSGHIAQSLPILHLARVTLQALGYLLLHELGRAQARASLNFHSGFHSPWAHPLLW